MSIRRRINHHLRRLEQPFSTHNQITVSSVALLHNYDLYRRLTKLDVIPVFKGNAYGHGIEQVATALTARSMPYIAVDGYFEALRIRAVCKQPVLVMGAIKPENFARIKLGGFTFVVHDIASIEALGRRGKPVKIHLEINTGMNRYGIEVDQIPAFVAAIAKYRHIQLEGVMSHLADADGEDLATVSAAAEKFDQAIERLMAQGLTPTMFHLAQSAGAPKVQSRYATAMRLGLGLYGVNPLSVSDPVHQQLATLRPALTLTSTITQTHDLKPGDQVSYNYTFTAPRPMRIGVLPLGYYEGVNRALSNAGHVTAPDHVLPIVGRVCMNHTMISLEGSSLGVGDGVTIISPNPSDPNSIAHTASSHNLFAYNLLTALSSDVRRVLV